MLAVAMPLPAVERLARALRADAALLNESARRTREEVARLWGAGRGKEARQLEALAEGAEAEAVRFHLAAAEAEVGIRIRSDITASALAVAASAGGA
jgi:hypothetical protein